MKKLAVLLLMGLIAGVACRKASSPSAPAAPAPSASPVEQLNHLAGGKTPPPQTKYFKGSIGTSLDLQMKLVRDGDNLTGSYFYKKVGTRITLRGTVDKNGNLTLDEFDPGGKQTGVFKGIWTVNSQDNRISLAGNWSKPPGEKGDDKKTAFSVHEEPINLTGDVELNAKQLKDNNKKLNYQIEAQYPQFTGGAATPSFEKFNQTARAAVMKDVSEFKKTMAPEEGEAPPPEDSMGSYLRIDYDVTLAQDDLISVKFDVSNYFQGAAHPSSYSHVVNYDLKNGRPIKLADLFKPGAKYLQAISAFCIADLKKQASEKQLGDEQIQEGAAPLAKNYQSWTISKQGLGINFDTYQVGAYAVGPQFVLVPYSALKDLIKPDGPIGQFAQ
jgi:hypothetical protein